VLFRQLDHFVANEARHQATIIAGKVQTGQANPSVLQHFHSLLKDGLSAPLGAKADPLAVHATHIAIAHGTGIGFLTAGLLALLGGVIAWTLITLGPEDIAGVPVAAT
jgi:hypothetical protein